MMRDSDLLIRREFWPPAVRYRAEIADVLFYRGRPKIILTDVPETREKTIGIRAFMTEEPHDPQTGQ